MGTFTQTTSIFTTGTVITFANNNDTWIINPGVVVSRANGAANGPTVADGLKTGLTFINNGHIFNGGTGDFADGSPYGITMFHSSSRILNSAGATISADGYAILTTGMVENAGTIVGGFGAMEGAGLLLKNTGHLLTGGVAVLTGGGATIENSGFIRGDRRALKIDRPVEGITTVENAKAGTIKGGVAPSVFDPPAAIHSDNGNTVALTNKGMVDGKVIFQADLAADKVVNKGTITGETRLGPGNDTFVFAGGKQGTVFGEGGADHFDLVSKLAPKKSAPVIGDFTPGEDVIGLSKKLFKGIGKEGPLKNKYFEVGKKAKDKDDHVIWDKAKGSLFFDVDGQGGDGQKLAARLTPDIDLTASDILVIA